jgi:hypothetical protein
MATELLLEEGKWPSAPLAPASVWSRDDEPMLVIELHRLLSLTGPSATFETYGGPAPLVTVGGHYSLYSWWDPRQLRIAMDTGLVWRPRDYQGSDHDHCLLTWETILPGSPAYVSEDGWITVGAYERVIRDDALRLRRA